MTLERMTIAVLAGAALAVVAEIRAADAQPRLLVAQAATPTQSSLAEGEVRKVDKDAGKITLKHGPIPSLDMPAMSMVFRAKDPAMLDQVKAGDRVRFAAEKIGGQYTVTRIERVQ